MKSCIYSGTVRHRRFVPVSNEFRYGLFMMYLDLDELPGLFDECGLWSYERANLACWRRKNYLGPRDLTLRDAVRFRLEDAGLTDHGGTVRMLTQMTYFGVCYNPVSFYFCFDKEDRHVETIIAEINNTPWNERNAYILAEPMNSEEAKARKRYKFRKTFHVSPFMPMNVDYDWRFSEPGAGLNIHMIDKIDDKEYFDATLMLERSEISCGALNGLLLKYPLMTARIMAGIYYQAFRLWMKKVPFYENPSPRPTEDRDYYDTVAKAGERRGKK